MENGGWRIENGLLKDFPPLWRGSTEAPSVSPYLSTPTFPRLTIRNSCTILRRDNQDPVRICGLRKRNGATAFCLNVSSDGS
jgi:hypothetical protein